MTFISIKVNFKVRKKLVAFNQAITKTRISRVELLLTASCIKNVTVTYYNYRLVSEKKLIKYFYTGHYSLGIYLIAIINLSSPFLLLIKQLNLKKYYAFLII